MWDGLIEVELVQLQLIEGLYSLGHGGMCHDLRNRHSGGLIVNVHRVTNQHTILLITLHAGLLAAHQIRSVPLCLQTVMYSFVSTRPVIFVRSFGLIS